MSGEQPTTGVFEAVFSFLEKSADENIAQTSQTLGSTEVRNQLRSQLDQVDSINNARQQVLAVMEQSGICDPLITVELVQNIITRGAIILPPPEKKERKRRKKDELPLVKYIETMLILNSEGTDYAFYSTKDIAWLLFKSKLDNLDPDSEELEHEIYNAMSNIRKAKSRFIREIPLLIGKPDEELTDSQRKMKAEIANNPLSANLTPQELVLVVQRKLSVENLYQKAGIPFPTKEPQSKGRAFDQPTPPTITRPPSSYDNGIEVILPRTRGSS